MNRQIKFRAWDKTNKKMIYEDFPFNIITANFGLKLDRKLEQNRYFIVDGNFEFQQFTGLLDKNDKMIYEGDIIQIYIPTKYDELKSGRFGQRITAQIRFNGGAFWFDGEGQNDCNWHFYNASDREIIGNIFENPELLISPRST